MFQSRIKGITMFRYPTNFTITYIDFNNEVELEI